MRQWENVYERLHEFLIRVDLGHLFVWSIACVRVLAFDKYAQ